MYRFGNSARRSLLVTAGVLILGMAGYVSAYAQGGGDASITIATFRDVPHLDRTKLDGGLLEVYNITDPLFKLDENGRLHPGVVDSWERIDDNRTRLTLREDVEFSDGEPLNGQSLKIALDRILEMTTSANLETWTGTEFVDDYTVDILHEPQVGLLHSMALFVQIYSPRQIQDDPQSLETAPIGTGPYRVVSYEPGRELQLEARDDYWGADVEGWGAPSIKNVTIRYGVEPGVLLAGLQAGELDLVRNLTAANAGQLSEDMLVVRPSPELFFLRFGFRDEVTSDPRVREAINLAIDREALNAPFLGKGFPATQIWPEHIPAWEDRGPVPEPDPERARQLVQEAGFDGREMEFVYSTEYKVGIGLMSQAVAAMIEDIGFQLNQTDMDGVRFREHLRETDDPSPLSTLSIGYDVPEPTAQLGSRFACDGTLSTYCSEEVDRLLDLARNTPDNDERREILQDLMDVIEEENGVIPLIAPPLIWGKSAALQTTPSYGLTMDLKSWKLAP